MKASATTGFPAHNELIETTRSHNDLQSLIFIKVKLEDILVLP